MSMRNMLILEENLKRHLEASELVILQLNKYFFKSLTCTKKKLFSCDLSRTDVLIIYLFEINIA